MADTVTRELLKVDRQERTEEGTRQSRISQQMLHRTVGSTYSWPRVLFTKDGPDESRGSF